MEIQILYALIANCDTPDWKIIASHSPSNPGADVDRYRDIIIATMKDLTTLEEEKISVIRDSFTVHLLIGELHYACLTKSEGSPVDAAQVSTSAQEFLEQVRSIYRELPILADLSRELDKFSSIDLSVPLSKIMGNSHQDFTVTVPALRGELAEIRKVLLESVQKLIDRGEKLEELIRKTQSLEITVHKDFRLIPKCFKKKRSICLTIFVTSVLFLTGVAFGTLMYIQMM